MRGDSKEIIKKQNDGSQFSGQSDRLQEPAAKETEGSSIEHAIDIGGDDSGKYDWQDVSESQDIGGVEVGKVPPTFDVIQFWRLTAPNSLLCDLVFQISQPSSSSYNR